MASCVDSNWVVGCCSVGGLLIKLWVAVMCWWVVIVDWPVDGHCYLFKEEREMVRKREKEMKNKKE